jgi:hypothetical protein
MDGGTLIEVDMATATDTCPSLEDIAAYLDGMLPPEERARVTRHLADCPDCFEIFAGAARIKLDEEDAGEEAPQEADPARAPVLSFQHPATAAPAPARRGWRAAMLVAAAGIVIALAAIPLYNPSDNRPDFSSEQILAQVGDNVPVSVAPWGRKVVRGSSTGGEEFSAASFQAGVQLVDLRRALATGQTETAKDIASTLCEIRGKHAIAGFPNLYCDAVGSPALLAQAAQAEEDLKDAAEPVWITFGQWTEAARLAALAGNRDFFRHAESQELMRWLRRHAADEDLAASIPSKDLEDLDAVRAAVDTEPFDAKDGQKVADILSRILQRHAPK